MPLALFGRKERQKALKKHSLGHSEPGAKSPKALKKHSVGHFPGRALSSPVNGGRIATLVFPEVQRANPNAGRWGATFSGERAVSRPGGKGSKIYVPSSERKEHKSFCPSTRRETSDQGDQTMVYVPNVYLPHLLPRFVIGEGGGGGHTPPISITKSMPSFCLKVVHTHHQFVSRCASHLYRDTFAEVLGSGVIGTPPSYNCPYEHPSGY